MGNSRILRPLADRFWEKVDKNGPIIRPELGPCWVWTASLRDTGYGQLMITETRIPEKAPRIAWFLEHGEWPPDDKQVCHKCDNRPCVRPDHLFLGTNDDNIRDKIAKGRQPRGIQQSDLTVDNVLTIRRLAGELPQTVIGTLFGIDQSSVSHIVTRRSWAHV